MPLLVAALALIEFGSIISDMFSGTYDFDLYNSGQNALHLFLTGSVIAGVSKLLGMRN